MNTQNILAALRKQKSHLHDQLSRVEKAISALSGLSVAGPAKAAPKKRTMSASARRKIAAAMRARWARRKAPKKPTISAAGRKRIAAAQRARWAKVHAGK